MIIIQHLTKTIFHKTLFEDISFKIRDGQKVGLIGPNGAGKTTLLNIISGREDADAGDVIVQHEVIGYLPQTLLSVPHTEIGQYLQSFLTESWQTYRIDEVLAKVGLKDFRKKTLISKLSGGEKMKVALAGVLLTDPTTLLFDEPTNNLDVEAIAWLEQFVKNFPGKVLVISHDRFFLDTCVNKIIELSPFTHKISEYGGNYSAYREQKGLRQENEQTAYDQQQKRKQEMEEWIRQKQEQLKYHPSNKVASQLQNMKHRLQREILDQELDRPMQYQSFRVQEFGNQLAKSKAVISIKHLSIPGLYSVDELYFFGSDRVQLAGRNGAGKTTLLRSILGKDTFFSGQIELGPNVKLGYFSQEHDILDFKKTVLQMFLTATKTTESQARNILGKFLFSNQKVFSLVQNLSEGEKARLSFAMIIHQHNDFLLLDEPTNHLDIESREVIAEALKEYEGGFLVISHDRYFLQQIGIERKLTIQGGEIVEKKFNI